MNPPDPAPPPSPAHVRLDRVRRALLVTVDELRTLLINDDDLHRPADTAVHEPLEGITELAEVYRTARGDAEAQPDDLTVGLPRRRYINPATPSCSSCPTPSGAAASTLLGGAPAYPRQRSTPNSTSPSAPDSCASVTPTPESTATRTPTGSTS